MDLKVKLCRLYLRNEIKIRRPPTSGFTTYTRWTSSCFRLNYIFMTSLLTTVGLNVISKTKQLIIKQDIGTHDTKQNLHIPHPPRPGYFKQLLEQLRLRGFASQVNSRHNECARDAVTNKQTDKHDHFEILASNVENGVSVFWFNYVSRLTVLMKTDFDVAWAQQLTHPYQENCTDGPITSLNHTIHPNVI